MDIFDANAQRIAQLPVQNVQMDVGNHALNLLSHWNTQTHLAGAYQVKASLYDAQQQRLELHTLPLDIIGVSVARLELQLSQAVYQREEAIDLLNTIYNRSVNQPLSQTRLVISVKDPQGQEVYHYNQALVTLAVGASTQLIPSFKLKDDALEGQYTVLSGLYQGPFSANAVIINGIYQNVTLHDSASARFNVLAAPFISPAQIPALSFWAMLMLMSLILFIYHKKQYSRMTSNEKTQ